MGGYCLLGGNNIVYLVLTSIRLVLLLRYVGEAKHPQYSIPEAIVLETKTFFLCICKFKLLTVHLGQCHANLITLR